MQRAVHGPALSPEAQPKVLAGELAEVCAPVAPWQDRELELVDRQAQQLAKSKEFSMNRLVSRATITET